uniref:Uncharacterized protein n=1 Tax=Dulem virus 36 TaxID=3145754 RepID=A0AAU8AZI2_9CAUD
MPCNLYNNNGFGCGGCTHFVRTTSVALVAGVLQLTIPSPTVQLTNGEKICICVAQSIPTGITSANTVAIVINGVEYPLRTRCGNNVHADQIRSRKVYHTNIATDIPAFTVSSHELCRTGFNFPVITP